MRYKLIEKRKRKKMTQEKIAEKLGIARTTYNAYELGTVDIPLSKAIQIKKIFKYSNDDIFFDNKCQLKGQKEG